MVDRFVVANVRRLPIFQNLPDAEIERLAGFFRVIRVNAGEFVFRQGEPTRGLYYINSGKAVLFQMLPDGSQRQLAVVGANQYLNDAALKQDSIETASLYAMETMIVLLLTRQNFASYQQSAIPVPAPDRQPTVASPSANRPQQPQNPFQTASPPVNDRYQPPPIQQPHNPQSKEDAAPGSGGAFDSSVNAREQRFDGQRPDETVRHMTRIHWWIVVLQMWKPVLMVILILIGMVLIENTLIRIVLFALAFVVPGTLAAYIYLEWYNDWLIITNDRVLHITKDILRWSTRVVEVPLQGVQGVQAEEPANLIARLLGFGHVVIQTAGDNEDLTIMNIDEPDEIKDYIFAEKTRMVEQADQRRQMQMIQTEMQRMFNGQPGNFNSQPGVSLNQNTGAQQPQAPPSSSPARKGGPRGLLPMNYVDDSGNTVYRQHWYIWWRKVVLPLTIALIGVGVLLFSGLIDAQVRGVVMLISGALVVLGLIWAYTVDWIWRNHITIVSDREIVLIHRMPLWLKSEDEHILLDRIDNTNAETSGILRSMLGFGDVTVKLLGDSVPKLIDNVPQPRAVREEISARQARARKALQDAIERKNLQATLEAINMYHKQYGGPPPQPNLNQGAGGNPPQQFGGAGDFRF